MTWAKPVLAAVDKLDELCHGLRETFAERDEVVELLALGAVCQEHLLLLGPPGTAKTELVQRFTRGIGAPLFSYLLTRFTEPSEIFGPLDMQAFNEGRYQVRTQGMLPAASIAFLDEVFHGSSAILNTLLTIVHERAYFNGATLQQVPLISLIGASNELPNDPTLRAFSDRFMLRVEVKAVSEARLDDLLDMGWELDRYRAKRHERAQAGQLPAVLPTVSEAELRLLAGQVSDVEIEPIRATFAQLMREIRAEGVQLSDRRLVKGLRLVAGAALLDKRHQATPADLWPLRHIWTSLEEAEVLRRVVDQHLATDVASTHRDLRPRQELLEDLTLLEGRFQALRGQTALGAHLMELGRLRREAKLQHAEDAELLKLVETAITRAMSGLSQMRPHV